MAELAPVELAGAAAKKSGARTSVVALTAPHEVVFKILADIEALPRWAGGFCEMVYLDLGSWRGLTVLGELWLELEINAHEGKICVAGGPAVGRFTASGVAGAASC
ncbi:MAG: hypothetical protein H7343_15280 [Undibacterium sp.]|nr:hypothetical protein [Opitutaceae bacterium]